MRYSEEVLDYVLDCRENKRLSFSEIAKSLLLAEQTVLGLWYTANGLRDGSLKYIQSSNVKEQWTLADCLAGKASRKVGNVRLPLSFNDFSSDKEKLTKLNKLNDGQACYNNSSKGLLYRNLKNDVNISGFKEELNSSSSSLPEEYEPDFEVELGEELRVEPEMELKNNKEERKMVLLEPSNERKQIKPKVKKVRKKPEQKTIPDDKEQKVIDLYVKEANSISEISKSLNLHATKIKAILESKDIEIRKISGQVFSRHQDDIYNRVKNGESLIVLAFEYGYTPTVIKKYMERY